MPVGLLILGYCLILVGLTSPEILDTGDIPFSVLNDKILQYFLEIFRVNK